MDDEKEIEECFYKDLKFGTGGIRAIMGPGPNKLNKYTIRKNTEGFAQFIESKCEEAKKKVLLLLVITEETLNSSVKKLRRS